MELVVKKNADQNLFSLVSNDIKRLLIEGGVFNICDFSIGSKVIKALMPVDIECVENHIYSVFDDGCFKIDFSDSGIYSSNSGEYLDNTLIACAVVAAMNLPQSPNVLFSRTNNAPKSLVVKTQYAQWANYVLGLNERDPSQFNIKGTLPTSKFFLSASPDGANIRSRQENIEDIEYFTDEAEKAGLNKIEFMSGLKKALDYSDSIDIGEPDMVSLYWKGDKQFSDDLYNMTEEFGDMYYEYFESQNRFSEQPISDMILQVVQDAEKIPGYTFFFADFISQSLAQDTREYRILWVMLDDLINKFKFSKDKNESKQRIRTLINICHNEDLREVVFGF